jgi:NitT/TauT family transport system substrate-binding protein
MLGSFCASTLSKHRVAPIPPSMLRVIVNHSPDSPAGYGGRGSTQDLAAMLRSHTHHHHPIGADLKKQIALYTDELKLVNVIKPSTDANRFADRVYVDVLS